ncbi:hypothetical protein B0I72DRAFT_26539 [Yarrowia lipolytica]|uniref:Uncharacterized protein n=1 Tax=Yarrowia lipolytica TaxID=4952 RepID=A0A1D8N4C6_YARLL|nr:hypothetical protein YALI1_A10468g [Yarrowia lipolytica]KAB8282958.1 hypothetical protein BKA91DRAFT_18349 [Yarrowia lipolytica]KAE8171890.1 hypothetical protein BKA90DRAFT_22754 [Yarrowia lipolytica]KAJ8051553.1 hypothetical protein LXG23DRAFT_39257 [Yarrowia lipolytica]RDW29287.1 hypothetical protein B0I72DRAFT_26539 [Yarrowia lipolytica]
MQKESASRGVPMQLWFQKMMETLGYRFLISKGNRDGVDILAAPKEFSNVTWNIIDKYDLKDMYNCDQTSSEMNISLKPNDFTKKVSLHKGKAVRQPLSVMFCVSADGKHKIPLHVFMPFLEPNWFKFARDYLNHDEALQNIDMEKLIEGGKPPLDEQLENEENSTQKELDAEGAKERFREWKERRQAAVDFFASVLDAFHELKEVPLNVRVSEIRQPNVSRVYLNGPLTDDETAAFEAEFPDQTKENEQEFYDRLLLANPSRGYRSPQIDGVEEPEEPEPTDANDRLTSARATPFMNSLVADEAHEQGSDSDDEEVPMDDDIMDVAEDVDPHESNSSVESAMDTCNKDSTEDPFIVDHPTDVPDPIEVDDPIVVNDSSDEDDEIFVVTPNFRGFQHSSLSAAVTTSTPIRTKISLDSHETWTPATYQEQFDPRFPTPALPLERRSPSPVQVPESPSPALVTRSSSPQGNLPVKLPSIQDLDRNLQRQWRSSVPRVPPHPVFCPNCQCQSCIVQKAMYYK